MLVRVPKLSGFCPGVRIAERRVFSELETRKEDSGLYILGMMINNRNYIKHLTENGVKTVDSVDSIIPGSSLFIRTHGIKKELETVYDKDFRLIDLTCKNVKKVQLTIEEKAGENAFIIISGKKTHPEVIGLKSYGNDTLVIENEEDLNFFITEKTVEGQAFKPDNYSCIFITSQTTGSRVFFMHLLNKIKETWPEIEINYYDSICPVTERKEIEASELQKDVQISFVIGDRLSSNATKLFTRLYNSDTNTYFIEDLIELKKLKINLSSFDSALVVSSASTPSFVEKEVVEYLESL